MTWEEVGSNQGTGLELAFTHWKSGFYWDATYWASTSEPTGKDPKQETLSGLTPPPQGALTELTCSAARLTVLAPSPARKQASACFIDFLKEEYIHLQEILRP